MRVGAVPDRLGCGHGGGEPLRPPRAGGGVPSPQRRKVAAALSAAATTTKSIGEPPLAWARKFEEAHKPIPSYSSGEGVWGRGASLSEAASPPAFFPP